MKQALRSHWPEYLMEALGLGLFLISAGLFGTLLEYLGSAVRQVIPAALPRPGPDGFGNEPDRDRADLFPVG